MSLRFVLLACLLLEGAITSANWITEATTSSTPEHVLVVSATEAAADEAGREDAAYITTDFTTTENYAPAFNGHVNEYVNVDLGSYTTLLEWFFLYDRLWFPLGAMGAWIKPGQDLTGRNIIMEFTIKNHYVLFIENNSLMLGETDGDGTEAEGGWSIYSYNLDLTSPDWIYVMVVVQLGVWQEETAELQDPSVFSKGLDKSTAPQRLEYSVIGRKQMMEGYDKTNQLLIGRGFRGSIALLTIFRWSDVQMVYHYTIPDCMEDREPSRCIFSGNQLRNLTYQISGPGSSIRWEINTIRPFFHSNIECKDFRVNIDIDPEGFDLATPGQERYYEGEFAYRTINFTLGDAGMGCNLTRDGDRAIYRISYSQLSDCGFTRTSLGNESTLYQNSVYQHTDSASKKLMNISCRYEPRPVLREEITIAAYVFEEISFTVDHTHAPVKMSLELYSDRFYSRKLENPAKLGDVDELIYVEARVYADSDVGLKMELEVESCRTHVTLNEHDTLQTKLIANFQPTNPSVTFIHSEPPTAPRKRFSFKAAQFKEYPNAMVYLSCVLSAKEDTTEPEKGDDEGEEERSGEKRTPVLVRPDDEGEEERSGEKRTPVLVRPDDETEARRTNTDTPASVTVPVTSTGTITGSTSTTPVY